MEYKEFSFAPNVPYEVSMGNFLPNLKDFYENPSKYNIDPFRIFGNLYYVGDKKVCEHLIDTGDGLILFDTGYAHNYDALVASIKTLGFNPEDIKYVIQSHGHFDHFGGSNRLRDRYGAKIFMSRVDTDLLREEPRRALMHLSPEGHDGISWPDVTIEDGDTISLGNTTIHCVLSPGHTFGTMSFFFDVTDGEKTLRVGYFGGVGFLTVYEKYCREYHLPENKIEMLGETIQKLKKEKVDIVIGNHPNQNCTLQKREYMISHPDHNPFINNNAWELFLDALEEKRTDFMKQGF